MEPRIREVNIGKILDILDNSSFTKHGFDCIYNRDEESVRIEFKDNPDYVFIISRSGNSYSSEESPGIHFVKADSFYSQDLDSVINRINEWIGRITEDILVSKKYNDAFGKLHQELDKASEEFSSPETPFDENQSQARRETLDRLVTQFEELKGSNKIRQAELDLLRAEVEILKENITSVPKGAWIKIFGKEMINIMEDFSSSIGTNLIEDAVRALSKGSRE